MTDRHGEGPIVRKAIDTVRALPQVDDAAVQRIVAAAAQAREHDVEPQADDLPAAPGIGVRELRLRLTHGARRRRIGVTALAAVAAAAVIASMLIGSPPW
ncbi:MAG TPA: hypothetical protein VJU87_12570, partial [Gemmatimonadaceae bacterium]|nr:hypothetical protein [Gemmatimonadaceae bacterium]